MAQPKPASDLSFFKEEVMIKNFVLSDFGTKTAYFSLVAAAVVFVSMLLLTGLHP
jgi:hypothetical protein